MVGVKGARVSKLAPRERLEGPTLEPRGAMSCRPRMGVNVPVTTRGAEIGRSR